MDLDTADKITLAVGGALFVMYMVLLVTVVMWLIKDMT